MTMPPGYAVSAYEVTCTGSAGGSASGSAAGPASPVNIAIPLPANQQWTCEVTATLADTATSDTVRTIPTSLQGGVVPTAPTPVPVAGAAGAASLGILGLAAWLGLRRRNKKDAA
ncbi:hypothetical protein HS961_04555 [Comamonas piscis]|uniref:Uncharacterized protein n=1 Tax=Comamonas piscis TaxID=1562974 RepID=A0A7G5EDT7_9BURK|nr:hypothetical protein [Comamonas piscis]QMV72162.1 hypothetical protein HS961_04555 [Comamonas piscis]WSO34913.1 hypothetical protein VUJ63_04580 [Comamonas piscis]